MKSEKAPPKTETNALAHIAIIVGASLSIVSILLVLGFFGNWNIAKNTGAVGDTIGGIAGPILNFTGLIIVYLSLREQFIANKIQLGIFKKTRKQDKRDRLFDTCLTLTQKLLDSVSSLTEATSSIEVDSYNGMPEEGVRIDFHMLVGQMRFLMTQFDFINKLSHKANLSEEQRMVIVALVGPHYLPALDSAHGKLGYIMNLTRMGTEREEETLSRAKDQIDQMTANFKFYRSY